MNRLDSPYAFDRLPTLAREVKVAIAVFIEAYETEGYSARRRARVGLERAIRVQLANERFQAKCEELIRQSDRNLADAKAKFT